MPIGYFLARNVDDAVQFCLLVNFVLFAINSWSLSTYDEDDIPEARTRMKVQAWASAFGLSAAIIFKAYGKYISVAIILAVISAAIYAFSATSEWAYASRASTMEKEGLITLSSFFWFTEAIQYFFIAVLALNNLLLAHFGRQELQERLGSNRVPNHEVKFENYNGGDEIL